MHSIRIIDLPEVGRKLPGSPLSPGGPGRPTPENKKMLQCNKKGKEKRKGEHKGT